MDRLQNAVPVAKGPGFLQLSVQLQGVLQPKIPSQKALYHNIKRDAKTVSDFLRPLLGRNQYCNEGCKKRATVPVDLLYQVDLRKSSNHYHLDPVLTMWHPQLESAILQLMLGIPIG